MKLEDNGPVRQMPRIVSLRSGRIRTGDGLVGCMCRNVWTNSGSRFLVCVLLIVVVSSQAEPEV